ncbi:MAG: type II and III secretion system protein family protein [Acetobacterales bacterium]
MRNVLLLLTGYMLLFFAIGAGLATTTAYAAPAESLAVEVNGGQLVRLDRPARTVFVANPKVADVQVKSPQLVYLFGKATGETTLFAVDDDDREILSRRVAVTHNLSRLRESIDAFHPGLDVEVASVQGALVLSGDVPTARDADDLRQLAAAFLGEQQPLINRLQVTARNQVNLRVRVAEVSRDITKQFGFNWDAVVTGGDFAVGIATGRLTGGGGTPITRVGDTNSLFGSLSSGNLDLNGVIDALESQGLIKVLAEPNLTAMSGEGASFLAGGEFPILVPAGDGTLGVQFKVFGISLSFRPTIVGSRISLHVRPEVSQLSTAGAVDFAGFNIPALTTRRAETVVELGSGQSFAIAGLLQSNATQDISKLPGLGDVPVLGALFRSDRFRRQESELVIIVTPYIVRPVPARQVAAPTDGYVAPHDAERLFLGATSHRRMPPGKAAMGLVGPVGFDLP